MTDKEQIIIDGIDVSKCKYLPYCNDKQGNCAFYSNCYFKQLARKTQECEELKKELMRKDEVNTFFNTPTEGWSNNPCDICESKNNYDRYRKALEEIEEYAKGMESVFIAEFSNIVKRLTDRIYRESTVRFKLILDIINEVKGEKK